MKNILLFFMIFIISINDSYTQSTFSRRYTLGSGNAVITSVYPTDSCFYAMGIITDPINPFSTGNSFIKSDLNGNILLQKNLSSPNKEYEVWKGTLQNTHDGNLAAVGYSFDSIGMRVIFLKYNSDGDTIFTKQFISPTYLEDPFYVPFDMVTNINNDHVIANRISNYFSMNYELLILDQFGEKNTSILFGDELNNLPISIINDNEEYIIGNWVKNDNLTNNNFTSRTQIVKIDSLGETIWEYYSPEGVLQRGATAMTKAPDGGLVVASGLGIEDPINQLQSQLLFDPYIFKLDENQNVVWEVDYSPLDTGLSDRTVFNKIFDVGDGYVAAGNNWDAEAPSGEDGYLVKISYDGEQLWERKFYFVEPQNNLPVLHEFNDMRPTADGGFIMCGQVFDYSQSTNFQQGWLVKVDEYGCLVPDCHLDVETDELNSIPQIILQPYPNPTSDVLNIYFKHPSFSSKGIFRIVDTNGRVLLQFDANKNDTTYLVSLEKFVSGIYFFQYLEKNSIVKTEQIIIQK